MAWGGEERRKEPLHCQEEILHRVVSIEEKIDKMMIAVYGNSDPARGFVVRIDRLEQTGKALLWVLGATGLTVIGLVVKTIFEAVLRR